MSLCICLPKYTRASEETQKQVTAVGPREGSRRLGNTAQGCPLLKDEQQWPRDDTQRLTFGPSAWQGAGRGEEVDSGCSAPANCSPQYP